MRVGMFLGSVGSDSGGPERYETQLVRHLAALDHDNQYELLCLFRDGPRRLVDQANFTKEALQPSIRPVSMSTTLPWRMARSRADVWHATYVPPTIRTRDYVYTLVCSSMIERPELYPPAVRVRLVALTRLAIRQARTIICISEHIRQVVQERFRVPDDRLAVTYLGVSDDFQPLDRSASRAFVRERYGVDRPYFLFSGRWEPRKNIMRIIEAFHRFKRETGSPAQLVFTGERTWAADEADRLIAGYGLSDDVVILGKSPVEELPQLYSGAEALVYPSLWEGFGLPIVEGMAAGLPVITSNNSSMAEVGGDAVELVDPLRVDDIAEAMAAIAGDPAHRETLRERGLARARIFDWRRTAEQTLAVYREQGRA